MKFNLKGKTAIVTGGGSGIGKAISKTLAEQGANVHILELNVDTAQESANEIVTEGGIAFAHKCNVAKHSEVLHVVNTIAKDFQIDILINNAGIAHIGNVENTSEEDMDKL